MVNSGNGEWVMSNEGNLTHRPLPITHHPE